MTSAHNGGPSTSEHQHFLDTILRQPKARNWMLAEWKYDDVENNFFNKANTFSSLLEQRCPKLRTRQLTIGEWRKLRRMFIQAKCRRFSTKFTEQTRNALHQYRRRHRILAENPHYQLPVDNMEQSPANNHNELFCLMVKLKSLLATKTTIIAELKRINGNGTIAHSNDIGIDAAVSADVLSRLCAVNQQILLHSEKMWCYRTVRITLLFEAMSKNHILLNLTPSDFRQFCAIQIYELHAENHTKDEAVDDKHQSIHELMGILLELTLAVIEQRFIGNGIREFFFSLLTEHFGRLELILTAEDMEYFQQNCLATLNQMV